MHFDGGNERAVRRTMKGVKNGNLSAPGSSVSTARRTNELEGMHSLFVSEFDRGGKMCGE